MAVSERAAWARLEGLDDRLEEAADHLRYTDQRAAYAVKRFLGSDANRRNLSSEDYSAQLAELKGRVKRSLLQREGRDLLVPIGAAAALAVALGVPFDAEIARPDPRPIPWHDRPTKALRPYQAAAVDALLAAGHGAVELAPGTGKTLIALHVVKELGLPAVVCSPFGAIVQQTHAEFLAALGPRWVGLYDGSTKDVKRAITVATTQSIHRARGAAADFFRSKIVVFGDEAHTIAADTLQETFLGLLAGAPYRFFGSGSLLRTDGLQPLLDGITGPVVSTMDALQAQAEGWLAPTAVRILEVEHGRPPSSGDPGRATQEVLYASKRVNQVVGALIDRMVAAGRPVLVMVDELPQFAALRKYVKAEMRFAHASTDAERLQVVPEEHRDVDVLALVRGFNAGEFPVLVGTAAVGTGVDIRATGAGFYLRGNKSEIDVRQAAGRFMRLHPGKRDALVFDVDPLDGGVVHRHTKEREKIWKRISGDVRRVRA